jgi:hypothetical protein
MKNRAKCKLCETVIESFNRNDYVTCKCGEISIDGGDQYFKCAAKDWDNFLRVDDEGNIIVPRVATPPKDIIGEDDEVKEYSKPTREELLKILEDMIKTIEDMPPQAMLTAVNQYDLMSLMMILLSVFKTDKS